MMDDLFSSDRSDDNDSTTSTFHLNISLSPIQSIERPELRSPPANDRNARLLVQPVDFPMVFPNEQERSQQV